MQIDCSSLIKSNTHHENCIDYNNQKQDLCINHTRSYNNKNRKFCNYKNKTNSFHDTRPKPQINELQTYRERPTAPHNKTQDLVYLISKQEKHSFIKSSQYSYGQREIGTGSCRVVVDNYGFVINENGTNLN
ncbi:hypothetical protein M0813_07756 [Anaeramoeba flamelloides]|uniref:Uncharacterized protein n=1 Tax=Anaeramoeba flamelloides TaxID=1746091 RepID=A0ABQ8XA27_9EUKA|nr:hypothetical protein M0813_07756 [Anaeramoeba flamelloides]